MFKIDFNNKGWQWAALIFMAFVWGTSFILMKKGLQSYSYGQVGAFRIFFSFVFSLPIIIKAIKKVNRANIKSLLIVGFVGTAIPAVLFTKAQTQINSSLAGMLNSLTPLFTLIIGALFYNSKARYFNVIGIFIGLIGAIGLMLKDSFDVFEGIDSYALFIVLATLCYGINVNEVKFKLSKMSGVEIAALGFFFTGPFCGIYLLFSDFTYTITSPDYILNLCYIAILALFSSVIALMIMYNLVKYTTTLFAASVTYIIPIFAILWGIVDGEKIMTGQLLWISAILLGVYLVNKKK